MCKRSGILVFLFFLFAMAPLFSGAGSATAQDIQLEGQVIDADTEEELVGVNIQVKDTDRGTTSDLDGNFSISVNADDVLTFSYLGYQSKEVEVDGRSEIVVELMSEAIYGEELVFIGYGTREVRDQTGSVSSISSEDFNAGSIRSPEELVQGRIPGVNITSADGAPGSAPSVTIRGGSSLSASNEPLYVIDEVPMAPGGIAGMAHAMNTINNQDIESINVLKDASATAIYGSRASNGVIVINTKRGQVGQPLSVSYSGSLTYETLDERIEPIGADEYRDVMTAEFGEAAEEMLGDENTDWQDQIFDDVISQYHNLSFSGAIDRLPIHASIGFTGDQGRLNTSNSDRLTGSVNLSPSLFNEQLDVDFNVRGSRVDNRFADQGAINTAIAYDPTQPTTIDNEEFGNYHFWGDDSPTALAPANPMSLLEQRRDESTVNRVLGNLKLDYELPFMDDLIATANVAYDWASVENGSINVDEEAAFAYSSSDVRGEITDYDETRENAVLDLYLNYATDLDDIFSSIDATAGYSWQHNFEEGNTFSRAASDESQVFSDTDFATENYLVSFFGRVNYALMDRYRLTATMRADGSSRFAPENRWGYFPSAALAWNINSESFMEDFENLSDLTLRVGAGITGQQEILQGNYPYLARYTRGGTHAQYRFGDTPSRTLRPEGFDAELKWEETTTYNVALNYGFYNDRIRGTLEAYQRETNDLLNETPVPAGSNFTNRIISNVGSMDVRGVEFDITASPVLTSDTRWEVSFNVARNISEIEQLTLVDDPDFMGVQVGDISGGTGNTIQIHAPGHPRNTFYALQQVYDEDGNPIEGAYVDRSGSGSIGDDDYYHVGSPEPDVTLGFSSSVDYRNFDASFSLRAVIGNYVYNDISAERGALNELFFEGEFLQNSPRSVIDNGFRSAQFTSDHYIEDASFLRLDNVSAGYTIDELLGTNVSARISGSVNNILTVTNYSGLDPEVAGGVDGTIYPRPRTFEMGIDLNF